MGGIFSSPTETLPNKIAAAIDNYMRFRGRGFFNTGTSSGANSDPYVSYEDWEQMDWETKMKVKNDYVAETFHKDYMSWRFSITSARGRVDDVGDLYH